MSHTLNLHKMHVHVLYRGVECLRDLRRALRLLVAHYGPSTSWFLAQSIPTPLPSTTAKGTIIVWADRVRLRASTLLKSCRMAMRDPWTPVVALPEGYSHVMCGTSPARFGVWKYVSPQSRYGVWAGPLRPLQGYVQMSAPGAPVAAFAEAALVSAVAWAPVLACVVGAVWLLQFALSMSTSSTVRPVPTIGQVHHRSAWRKRCSPKTRVNSASTGARSATGS